MRFFARLEGKDSSFPSFGLIAMVKDPKKADRTLAEIAELLGISKKKGKGTRYGKKGFPLEIGRKGRLCFLLGVAPSTKDDGSVEERLNDFQRIFLTPANAKKFPASLKDHLSQNSDLALYLDGTGLAKIIEDFWPDDQWKKLLPALDELFNRQIGFHFQSNQGTIRMTATEYSGQTRKEQDEVTHLPMLEQLPRRCALGRSHEPTGGFLSFVRNPVHQPCSQIHEQRKDRQGLESAGVRRIRVRVTLFSKW